MSNLPNPEPSNTIARDALDELKRIDSEAEQKRQHAIERIRQAKGALLKRRAELDQQIADLDSALTAAKAHQPEEVVIRHHSRGQNVERVERLLAYLLEARKLGGERELTMGQIQRDFFPDSTVGAVNQLLGNLVKKGTLDRPSRGRYALPLKGGVG